MGERAVPGSTGPVSGHTGTKGHISTDPGLLTFLIADIRGYSTFTRERGDSAAALLAQKFADLARDAVEARSGRVIELRGDEAFALFDSAAQAVRAAVELQATFTEESRSDPVFQLPVGIGIDTGEAVPVEEGYRGLAVNMAARLCSNAAAGQVLVTRAVTEHVGLTDGLVFAERGPATFKGFDDPVDVIEALPSLRPTTEGQANRPIVDSRLDAPEWRTALRTDETSILVGREHEMRWARGTWRSVRRGNGRVVCVSGPSRIGKTRLATEIASYVDDAGGSVWYSGAGGTALADALNAVQEASIADRPTIVILDDIDAEGPEVADGVADALDAIAGRPSMMVLIAQSPDGLPALGALVERIDVHGDGHRRLPPLDQEGVREIGRTYLGEDVEVAPLEAFFRSSGGVPGRVHEVVSGWAREEATRRLSAAAEWLVGGRTGRANDLEFANNVLGLKLDQLFRAPGAATEEGIDVCPYRGLATFREEDARFFFGRERLVGELAARSVDVGVLGIIGASGSGKSSVISAGLGPSLAAGLLPGSERWQQVSLRPGEHPMTELRAAIRPPAAFGPVEDPVTDALARLAGDQRLVVVVDQFEEAFTTCTDDGEREAFIETLTGSALAQPERLLVIVSLRADFYGQCAAYPLFAGMLGDNHVLLGPMSKDELHRAIELPARRTGLRVESALTDRLVEDVVDEPGGLPLLSTTLVELWQQREDGWLRAKTYERSGGVQGAVARLAEGTYGELTESEREVAPGVFLRLVGPGEGEAVTRRRVPVAEFDLDRSKPVAAVIDRFTQDRLLTRGDGTVEVAHEAVLREWPRLQTWVVEDAQGREIRTHLAGAARAWEDSGQEDSELYRGARLSATLDWASTRDPQLNDLERGFLTAGRQASERDVERQRRTNRRLRGLLVGVALFLVVALVAGSIAIVQRSSAGMRALQADAQRIGAQALTEPNLDKAMLMAVAGVRLDDNSQTRASLLATLERSPAATRLIRPSTTSIGSVAVSPDGSLLAVVDGAHVLSFWSLPSFEPSGAPMTLDDGTASLYRGTAFTADGRTLIVGAGPDLYSINIATRTQRLLASWQSNWSVVHVAVAPGGSLVAVALGDYSGQWPPVPGKLTLIDVRDGHTLWRRTYPSAEHQHGIWLGFRPRHPGRLITSAMLGHTYVWDVSRGRILQTFKAGGPLAISSDGRFVALAQNTEDDPTNTEAGMALLDLRTGAVSELQGGLNATIGTMSFTPDGRSIIAGSAGPADNNIYLWDLRAGADKGRIMQTFSGQAGAQDAIAMTPDGSTFFSGANDGSVIAWDLTGSQRLGRTVTWGPQWIGCYDAPCVVINHQGTLMAASRGVDGSTTLVDLRKLQSIGKLVVKNTAGGEAMAFFPDGQTLATGYWRADRDGQFKSGGVTVWNTQTRRALHTFARSNWADRLAVSPDGKSLAMLTPYLDGSWHVQLWDMPTWKLVRTFAAPAGAGLGDNIAFSPDGRELAVSGTDVKVWDTSSGKKLFDLGISGRYEVAFSPDSKLLAVGTGDGQVMMLDARSGAPSGSPLNAAGAVYGISFSPNEELIALSTNDLTVSLWDVRSSQRVGTFRTEGTGPGGYFLSNGDLVVVAEGWVALWPVDVQSWVDYACQIAGRDLTPDEWSQLLPNRPYQPTCPASTI